MADYNIIGSNYNQTRRADPTIVQQIEQLLAPQKGLHYLDIGCGTGNYTIALSAQGFTFYGLDPSANMLVKAAAKSDKITWTIGAAENLPFEDSYFSGAIATLTIHHWQNLQQAFAEIYRVLKPQSYLVIFTATAQQMQNYWLNHYFPAMMQKSTRQMPDLVTITNAASSAGFKMLSETLYFIDDNLQDLFLYSGKNNPSSYLSKEVRQNISSFTNLADEVEVSVGLSKLSTDIQNGNFDLLKSEFNTDRGDYLFLRLYKP